MSRFLGIALLITCVTAPHVAMAIPNVEGCCLGAQGCWPSTASNGCNGGETYFDGLACSQPPPYTNPTTNGGSCGTFDPPGSQEACYLNPDLGVGQENLVCPGEIPLLPGALAAVFAVGLLGAAGLTRRRR